MSFGFAYIIMLALYLNNAVKFLIKVFAYVVDEDEGDVDSCSAEVVLFLFGSVG